MRGICAACFQEDNDLRDDGYDDGPKFCLTCLMCPWCGGDLSIADGMRYCRGAGCAFEDEEPFEPVELETPNG